MAPSSAQVPAIEPLASTDCKREGDDQDLPEEDLTDLADRPLTAGYGSDSSDLAVRQIAGSSSLLKRAFGFSRPVIFGA